MSDERILEALQALKEVDRELEASPDVGVRLQVEFRARWRRRVLRRAAGWMLAAAAAVMAAFLMSRAPSSEAPAVAVGPERILTAPSQAVAELPPVRIRPRAARRSARASQASVRVIAPAAAERGGARDFAVPDVVTGFYPLMDPAPPFERGQILRVNLPASAMRAVGLPVHEDRLSEPVRADVLLGEEGLPRAIRFIGFRVR